jgi:hypothetical protein
MDKGKPFSGCNGHQRCEEYCSGPIEQFLYYNNTKQKNPKDVSAQDTKDKVSWFNSIIFGARTSELLCTWP